MKSFRLDEPLATRLREAAVIYGEPESQIIRKAIEEHCDRLLEQRADYALADVIGAIEGGGGRARNSSKLYGEALAENHRQKQDRVKSKKSAVKE